MLFFFLSTRMLPVSCYLTLLTILVERRTLFPFYRCDVSKGPRSVSSGDSVLASVLNLTLLHTLQLPQVIR